MILACKNMYALYGEYLGEGSGRLIKEVGLREVIQEKTINYQMDKKDFIAIYDGSWPLSIYDGDLEDWEKLR